MNRRLGAARGPLLAVALLGLLAAVALPALAADPSAAPGASDHPGKGPKASKAPEVAVTLRGTVGTTKNAEGETEFTLTVDGKVLRLDAGPSWFHGNAHPLKPFVGETVTVTGGQRADEVDVETVNGTRLRAEGKPPWAGGWKRVGAAHPGWSQEKADRWAAKHGAKGAAGGCWPPGHCKERSPDVPEAPGGN